MRIRTIKPEFFNHEAIYELEEETGLPLRLAFIGLWCAVDREGRFKWQPRRLGVQIMPYDKVDFSRVLDALTTRGFVVRYTSDDGEFGYIPSFPKHQVINNREKPSELPNPDKCTVIDACLTRDPRVTHASKAEGKGREGNMEGKGRDICPQADVLDEVWNLAPVRSKSRSSKKQLNDAWKAIPTKDKPSDEILIQSLHEWIKSDDWTKDGGNYAQGIHLWLKNRKWEVSPTPQGSSATSDHRAIKRQNEFQEKITIKQL
jgi:hypothetical protein